MAKYGELCRVLLGAGYTPVTVYQYLTDPPGGRTVVLRHDVDRKPENALKMAELEHALGVCSTYYFRHPATFVPEVIGRVQALGHEVGYHYEVLAKGEGRLRGGDRPLRPRTRGVPVSLRRPDDLHAREPPLPLRQPRPLEEV
jgi:hypothetical protein